MGWDDHSLNFLLETIKHKHKLVCGYSVTFQSFDWNCLTAVLPDWPPTNPIMAITEV